MGSERTLLDITECSERQIRSWCHELSPDTVCDLLVELVARTKKPPLTEYEKIGQLIDKVEINSDTDNQYQKIAKKMGDLVSDKQKQYGNSFGKAAKYLKILYPDGVQISQYDDMLALVRDFDKSMRIANGNQGDENAWMDKCGYALLAIANNIIK